MRRAARDCCHVDCPRAFRWRAWLAFVLLAAPVLAQAALSLQLRQAEGQVQAGGTFGAPPPVATPDPTRWQPVGLPHVLPRGLAPAADSDPIDIAWVRVPLPPEARALERGTLRLYVPRWQTIGQVAVYVDGRLIHRSGAGPVWNGFNHPLWLPLDAVPAADPPGHVLIRIDHLRSAGAALSTVWVGDDAGLARGRWLRELVQAGLPQWTGATVLVIGLFALCVWTVRREVEYGLFFLAAVMLFVRNLHYHLGLEPLPMPEAWFGWLTVHAMSGLAITVNIFGLRLHGKRYPAIEWPLIALAGGAALLGMPGLGLWQPLAALAPLFTAAVLAGFLLLSALGLWSAWRARAGDSLLLMVMNILSVPAAAHDVLLQNYRLDIERVYLLPLTTIGLFAAYLFVMVRRYVGAIRSSERAQQVLEEKLQAREAELTASHARLRAIEHEQILNGERQRLMQDMHDGLGSSLMGALKAVENGYDHDLAGMLRECIDDLKLAIDSLEPVQSDLLLLLATLRYRLGTRLEQAGVRLNWQVEDVPAMGWLDPGSTLNILRILQEVLANVVKHSGAGAVTLSTRREGDCVVVAIEDDGCGFEPAHAASGGRGLANVARRAEAIGGSVRWLPGGAGTAFELVLPIDKGGFPGMPAAAA
jgi:signal transduction histidine kinase